MKYIPEIFSESGSPSHLGWYHKHEKEQIFSFTNGARIVTDLNGNLIEIIGIATKPELIQFKSRKEYSILVRPNTIYRLFENGNYQKHKSYKYFQPTK